MIVLDSSALVAILRREPEAAAFARAIAQASRCLMSSVSLMETSMVLAGRAGTMESWADLDALIARAAVQVEPHDAEQARASRAAFLR